MNLDFVISMLAFVKGDVMGYYDSYDCCEVY